MLSQQRSRNLRAEFKTMVSKLYVTKHFHVPIKIATMGYLILAGKSVREITH